MTLAKRLLYYFSGFGIGMIILFFFLGGKRASCDYFPNARTLKNLREKERIIPPEVLLSLESNHLDTSAIGYLFNHGIVDFKDSNTSLDSCKIYAIKGDYKEQHLLLHVENCDHEARIKSLEFIP